ncbi:MAG: orotate phosphoribosyltransferase-like protein, partial [Methanobrevibacter sp.]|nr:orotate phosphoribosyltransferase-like protein [Methanobrevibacter sp.]
MSQELIKKAQELKNSGFTTGEMADELNVSLDTALWLSLQKIGEDKIKDAPLDFAISWNNMGGDSTRLRYTSSALAEMIPDYEESEVVLGIAISGIPFATIISNYLYENYDVKTSLAVFHPIKEENKSKEGRRGTLSKNFASVKGKKVVIVDDLATSGRTLKDAISVVKSKGGTPI